MWVIFAFASALFAGLTAILAKCGIRKTDSDAATAIRTIVVLLFIMADGVDRGLRAHHHVSQCLDVDLPYSLGPGHRRLLAVLL